MRSHRLKGSVILRLQREYLPPTLALLLRRPVVRAVASAACALPQLLNAQDNVGSRRALRRDIPITSAIRRAYAAGTRDSTGRPGRNYWQLTTDYVIDARLDPQTSRITGRETITIHNNSPDSLDRIGLRLDMNLFRFGAPLAPPFLPAEPTDGFVITALAVDGRPVDLTAVLPQSVNGKTPPLTKIVATDLQSTNASLHLVDPIRPHSTATLLIAWNHKVPGGPGRYHRMTQRWGDTLYQPTQWYPRVAVYDDLRGWDPEPYLGESEFYNNFGRFDVRIDVPAGWIVSGTGVLQNPDEVLTPTARARVAQALGTDSVTTIVSPAEVGPGRATAAGDRLIWHFVADSVNDFAWATAKHFVWQATRAAIPGRGVVPIHMLFLPEHASLFSNAGPIARHALEFYSKLLFPYRFPQLTLQDGPDEGMEYPMVINANQRSADHETGHQWWPMTVSNNETWYGWMDEGFNEYLNPLSNADRRGLRVTFDGQGQAYGKYTTEAEPPMMWDANYAGSRYGDMTYGKAPMMLAMLGGIVGDSAVLRAQAEWARAWRLKHPSPWDYMFFMSRALHQDLGWFWYYWLFTTETVDGSIDTVAVHGNSTTVTVRQSGEMPSPVLLKVEFEPGPEPITPMSNAVVSGDVAVVTYPVDVWFSGNRTFAAELAFGRRAIRKITLDPNGRFPDRDPADNVWPRQAR